MYLASESSFTRVLREQGQTTHRGRSKAPKAVRHPTTHIASAVRQVWCWDMTYLPAIVMGRWFHLYLILDLYSRKIVGWEAPRVTILVACIDPRTLGSAMKEIRGTLRTDIQGQSGSSVVAA